MVEVLVLINRRRYVLRGLSPYVVSLREKRENRKKIRKNKEEIEETKEEIEETRKEYDNIIVLPC